MPDAGTAFDGSIWVAGTSAVGLVIGSAAVTALGATVAAVGLSRLDDEAMVADDSAELEAAAAADQASKGSEKEDDKPQQGRERIKRS